MPCPRSRRANPIVYFAARTLPPLSAQSFSVLVSSQPLPLHSFFDLQELSAPEQEPWPLHSLMPAHFTTSAVFLADFALATAAPDMNMLATALAISAFFIDMCVFSLGGWYCVLRLGSRF